MGLNERNATIEKIEKEVIEKIKKEASVILKTLLEVHGLVVDKEKVDGNNVHFKIDGKDYYLYVNVNRDRKGHWDYKYVGSSCGDSINDSMYEKYWVNDEEEYSI